MTDYETIREKASCHKRDVERALTRFVARTGETQSFFLTEDLTYFPRKRLFPSLTFYFTQAVPILNKFLLIFYLQ